MKRTKQVVFLAILAPLLLASDKLFAQAETDVAFVGPLGIYIFTGKALGNESHPTRNIVGYKIERKSAGEGDWKTFAELSAPESRGDLLRRYTESIRDVPYQTPSVNIDLEKNWIRLDRYHELDSLPMRGAFLNMRLSLGVMYLDSDVRPGTTYEYRVSSLAPGGGATEINTQRIVFQTIVATGEIYKRARAQADTNRCDMLWHKSDKGIPAWMYVYRRSGFGEFSRTSLRAGTTTIKDALYYFVSDTSVKSGIKYSYYIQPLDYFGNAGITSDTLSIISLNPKEIRLPDHLRATVNAKQSNVKLSWEFHPDHQSIGLRIYRANDSGFAFKKVGEVGIAETGFVDATIIPDRTYFYALRVVNANGDESPRTAKVFAVTESARKPLAPFAVSAVAESDGVHLEWHAVDPNLRGYFVYRGNGAHAKLMLLPGMIRTGDASATTYLDTDKSLSPKITYSYAVISLSTSNVESGFSDTARVQPYGKTIPPTPVRFDAMVSGDHCVKLFWDDMKSVEITVIGYQVFRREAGTEEFLKLGKKVFSSPNNNFVDSNVTSGESYEYYVRSFDAFGGVSEGSFGASVNIPQKMNEIPPTPMALHAEPTSDGIELTWGGMMGAKLAGFKIYRHESDSEPSVIASVKQDAENYLDTSAKQGVLYWYSMTSRSFDDSSESPQSREVRVKF